MSNPPLLADNSCCVQCITVIDIMEVSNKTLSLRELTITDKLFSCNLQTNHDEYTIYNLQYCGCSKENK